MNRIDLSGRRFGRLLVLDIADKSKNKKIKWNCICDCGNKTVVQTSNLTNGHTQSCGCKKKNACVTHGKSKDEKFLAEYRAWGAMHQRCNNKNVKQYNDYGGRGISVCERWKNFDNFIADMGSKPTNVHTLDRIDVNGNYCPENCRWTTRLEQSRN